MRKKWPLFFAFLLLLSALSTGASAYEKGGSGPTATADLGDYHFVYQPPRSGDSADPGAFYVQKRGGDAEMGALLTGVGEAVHQKGIVPYNVTAAYDANGAVVLTIVDIFTPSMTYIVSYTTDSLDQAVKYRLDRYRGWVSDSLTFTDEACVALLPCGYRGSEYEVAVAPSGTAKGYAIDGPFTLVPDAPWSGDIRLLPYNGKTFMVEDAATLKLYASKDGKVWTQLMAASFIPEVTHEVTSSYRFTWTGSEYMSCRRVAEGRYGMMGYAGGNWYAPECTQVCFYDEDFQLISSYDFGRQVRSVGYYGGVYYAEVGDYEGVGTREFSRFGPSTIYASKDKITWEKTDITGIVNSLREIA